MLRETFIKKTQSLLNDDIEVQRHITFVNKYRTAELWDNLMEARCEEIEEHILPLLPPESAFYKVKSFDLLIYTVQDEYFSCVAAGEDVRDVKIGSHTIAKLLTKWMNELLKLKTIPDVTKHEKLITAMIDGNYLLEDYSIERSEYVRKILRELMIFIPDKREYHIVNFEDKLITETEDAGRDKKSYQDKAKKYIESSNDPALVKLRNLEDLTDAEKDGLNNVFMVKLGTPADFAAWAGNQKLLPFLRMQVGIADAAIQFKFGSFLNSSVLNDAQLNYMNQIISYTRGNGDITFSTLQSTSPFSDMDVMALFGDKISYIKQLINGLHKPVM
jgi:type I restriction enzyme R subunit